jgi:hypothetical protein
MRLSRDDQVAGIPATDARKLMRRFGDAQPESRIGSWVDTGSRTGTEVARAFADAGYLRVSAVYDAEAYWETTIQGNALAQARFGRPITRATAERHLAGVIGRAKKFNADGSHVVDIAELVVFGSYLDPDVQHLHARGRADPHRPMGGRLQLRRPVGRPCRSRLNRGRSGVEAAPVDPPVPNDAAVRRGTNYLQK